MKYIIIHLKSFSCLGCNFKNNNLVWKLAPFDFTRLVKTSYLIPSYLKQRGHNL